MQQIAKMFASLGFKVDTTGLDVFKLKMRDVRGDMTLLARNARVVQDKFNGVSKALKDLNANLKIKKTDTKLSKTYDDLKISVEKVDKAFKSITRNQKTTTQSLGKIHGSIIYGERKWKAYADQVQRTKDLLRGANEKMKELRSNASVTARVKINESGSRVGGNSQQRQNGTTVVPMGGFGRRSGGHGSWLGGIAPFFSAMSPSVALGGGLAASGFALKEVVKGGREMQTMQNIMTAATKDQMEYANAMEYVRKESNRLGQSTKEMGSGFAKVLQSAQGKMGIEKTKRLFTGFGELMTVFGSSVEDQQGVYRAIGQMLSKGKVEAEEVGQLAERGISRELIKRAAEKTYGLKTDGDYEKYQKAGKVKIPEIADNLSEMLRELANRNGALEKALNNSRVAQQKFNNQLDAMKLAILEGGLDSALAKMFNSLTALSKAAMDLGTGLKFSIDGLKQLKQVLDQATNGNGLLSIAVTVLSVLLLRKGRVIISLVKQAKNMKNVFIGIKNFFNGGLGRALLTVARRFLGIITVITTLWSVGKALNQRMQGQTTWIDVWSQKLENLALMFEVFWLQIQLGAIKTAQAVKSPWSFAKAISERITRDAEFDSYFGNGASKIESRGVLKPAYQQNKFNVPARETSAPPSTIALPNSSISHRDSQNMMQEANKALFEKLGNMKGQVIINIDGRQHLADINYFGNAQTISLMG